ncbi:MAG: tRNA (adenosine(37)-N6)-threonylcarbamoyltransferase complex ATPase subunit type 1 TsaE [Planctomycetes bacterium]|nr:tRNA (adenosine(37)-N6)-threonylcarbamoyltransferase complex ATPase subunit type 1 TsaE [Planctomycetota bacterium]
MAAELSRRSREFVTRDPQATERLAEHLARGLEPGTVLALDGELGAGKTCFVRGLARGLDSVDPVASPTYTLMHEYRGRLPLYHFDAWMQGREEAFLAGGGAEWLEAGGVAAVEWAERVAEHLPRERLHVELAHRRDGGRTVRISVLGGETLSERARGWLAQLDALDRGGEQAAEDARGD